MGGCAAAQVGWGFLCQAGAMAWQLQAIADRVTGAAGAISTAGPLPLVLLLLLALAALALTWHVFLALAEIVFRYFPLVLVVVFVALYMSH